MAATRQARRLTEGHRLAQANLRKLAVTQLAALWGLLEPDRLDESTPGWITANTALVGALRRQSAVLAGGYLQLFREAETGDGDVTQMLADVPPESVSTSLAVTGPIAVKTLIGRGVPRPAAYNKAFAFMSGAATRHILDGGRQTLIDTASADPHALGWSRVTDGSPCAFCALVAGRGPVFHAESSADFEAHDGCGCTAEPIYDADAPWPGRNREFQGMYRTAVKEARADGTLQRGTSNDALNAFRRAYEKS